ncbi:hypothetical protein SLE2022_093180 [Rubroshorea leprosula]
MTCSLFCSKFSDSQEVADEKISHTGSFLKKIEAAHATMKEVEYMLNALLNQNKNAKESNNLLQQASEELMAERAILIREVEQLRYLINLKERENESLQDQMNNSLGEISSSITLLEKCFLQMQSQAEDSFEVLYSDIYFLPEASVLPRNSPLSPQFHIPTSPDESSPNCVF